MPNRISTALFFRDSVNRLLHILTCLFFPRTGKIIDHLKCIPGKILILRTGNIGDIACALPALEVIRENFPNSKICLLTSPGIRGLPEAREVLDGLGLVDEIFTFYINDLKSWHFRLNLLKKLRRQDFDLFILLPQTRTNLSRTIRDLLFARIIGVSAGLGFTLSNYFPFFRLNTLKNYVPQHNEVQRLLNILARAGINRRHPFTLKLPSSAHQWAVEFLKPFLKAEYERPVIGFQVFAKCQANQWPLENFIELGKRLQKTLQPLFIFFGGAEDRPKLKYIVEKFPGDNLVSAGEASILESTALLARCNVLVTLDTGLMHLAALIGTPIIALFSARQFPKMWEPFSDRAIVLRSEPPCRICFKESCDHIICMKDIKPLEVYEKIYCLLKSNCS